MKTETHIIDFLGGPTKVAEMLGLLGKPGAIQRVANWKRRGIPSRVLISNPEFYKKVVKAQRTLDQ